MAWTEFIDRALSRWFKALGHVIGLYPGYFVVIPFLVSLIFATGLQRLHYEDDPEYLFSPRNGRSRHERGVIDELFPMNYTTEFNLGRITHKGRFGRLILVANDGGSVLRKSIFDEVVKLDEAIRNFTIWWDDVPWKFGDLCAKSDSGKCTFNDILDFKDRMQDIEDRKFFLEYPLWFNRERLKAYFFPAFLGGVDTDANKLVTSAKAINLMYFLDISVKRGDERAGLWEDRFITFLSEHPLTNITVSKFVSSTLRTELESNTQSLVPFFSITVIIMLMFSVGTCMMADWVRSKPWLGLLGCVSAGLGVAASFGLCVYCQVDMIGINLAAPFLMLGVGMDDAFVLLAAWRRTSPSLSVSERLGHTYAEAAVSITITSITNFISFMIGTITPFPSVRIFCIYTSVAVLFTYVYHVTFFGGCMALFGHAERRNLHGLVCVPVMPKSVAGSKGYWYQVFCTGGRNPEEPDHPEDNRDHCMMIFFRDTVAVALNKASVKVLVITVFIIYLAIGIWGCTMVKEGLDRKKLSRDDSYSVKFYDFEDKYFREYPYRIQVVINETLNFADPDVRDRVETILGRFESSHFVANRNLTESWLRAYMRFIEQEDSFIFLQALNMSDPLDFYTGLKNIFLRLPGTESFRNDVLFNDDASEIMAARFVIQTTNITDANMEKEMLIEMRAIADEFKGDKITIYNHLFIFFDQFILVRGISLQTIGVAALVMMGISLVFIPSPSCAIWVAFSIVSIEIGVVGYMTHWGVNLDSISMINLIMCIGFSVDFSAHISYAYISCEEETPAARVRSALYSLGLPIFQGSVSTILGIVALAFAPSYVFVTFFKTVFLVMLFGATHGVLLLPVLLSLTDSAFGGIMSTSQKRIKNEQRKGPGRPPGHRGGGIPPSIDHPFYGLSDKAFDGKNLTNNGVPIFIPRPSFTNSSDVDKIARIKYGAWAAPDADSGQGSKSSASSEGGGSCGAEKDHGIGTSAEEYSEGSWKESKDSDKKSIIKKEAQVTGLSGPPRFLGAKKETTAATAAVTTMTIATSASSPTLYRQMLYSKWPPVSSKQQADEQQQQQLQQKQQQQQQLAYSNQGFVADEAPLALSGPNHRDPFALPSVAIRTGTDFSLTRRYSSDRFGVVGGGGGGGSHHQHHHHAGGPSTTGPFRLSAYHYPQQGTGGALENEWEELRSTATVDRRRESTGGLGHWPRAHVDTAAADGRKERRKSPGKEPGRKSKGPDDKAKRHKGATATSSSHHFK